MKSVLVLIVSCILPLSSYADEGMAIKAFTESEQVKAMILEVQTDDATLEPSGIKAIEISGGCGFAGCDVKYLVVEKLTHHGTNTYFTSVTAVVTIPAVGLAQVQDVTRTP